MDAVERRRERARVHLEDAVRELVHADDESDQNGLVTAWALVTHERVFIDGEERSVYTHECMNGAQDSHVTMGLLQLGLNRQLKITIGEEQT